MGNGANFAGASFENGGAIAMAAARALPTAIMPPFTGNGGAFSRAGQAYGQAGVAEKGAGLCGQLCEHTGRIPAKQQKKSTLRRGRR